MISVHNACNLALHTLTAMRMVDEDLLAEEEKQSPLLQRMPIPYPAQCKTVTGAESLAHRLEQTDGIAANGEESSEEIRAMTP